MSEFLTIEGAFSAAELQEYEDREKRKRAEEAGALLLDGLGFWVPPLVDVFIGNSAYVWYRLLQTGGGADLEIERCDGASIGEPQTWFEEYEDTSNFWYGLTGSRWDGARGLCFALERGIAPGTPFLMQFGPPHWYRSGYEVIEYDCEYDYEIVRVLPRDPMKGAASFARAFAIKRRHDTARARYKEKLDAWQRKNKKSMFITQELFYADGYDEMSPPNGKRVFLETSIYHLPHEKNSYGWGRQFFSAEDKSDWEPAFAKLRDRAERELGLTAHEFNNLPKRWRP